MSAVNLNIYGGGWVTAAGFGEMHSTDKPLISMGEPQVPKGKAIFRTPLTRYGRFDRYTKIGCAGIALALRDAGMDQLTEKSPVGIVLSTQYECFESDLQFYESTLEDDGFFSSPNLFSYTLPGIVLGESAIHFKLTGPTFTMGQPPGEDYGLPALTAVAGIIASGLTDIMIAGWLDSPPDLFGDAIHGAVFVVLGNKNSEKNQKNIIFENGQLKLDNGKVLKSVTDMF